MNSQEAGSSTYRSLAQQRAVVSCQLEPQSLPRFAQACGVLDTVSADLTFSLDDQGRVMVKGRVVADAELGCHRCEEMVPKTVDATFTARIAFSEEQAAISLAGVRRGSILNIKDFGKCMEYGSRPLRCSTFW